MQKYPVVAALLLLAQLLLLVGCLDRSLTFSIRFTEVSGLTQNDRVYFGRNDIGRVEKVTYTNTGEYLVEVNVRPEFTEAVTEDSTFFIGHAPGSDSIMAVIVEQERPGGAVLQPGVTVAGSKKPGYFDKMFTELKETAAKAESELNRTLDQLRESYRTTSQQLDQDLDRAMMELSRQLEMFGEKVEKLPDSQEVQRLEESVNQFVEEFGKAQQEVQEQLRDEVLPRFRRELDRLREKLRQEGRGQELERVDEQIKELEMV